jgi:hypothetical protein
LSADALAQLRQRWPDYRKPMPATRLATRIDQDALERIRRVEPELACLLDVIAI